MFVDKVIEKNKELINIAFDLHKKGVIEPDTYILDLDRTVENARQIKLEADKYGIKLYFMSKQFGRNPLVCKELMKLGYEGAVVVDFKEAEIMIDNGIKIGHIGHLVQIPSALVKKIVASKPEYITVYSIEKAIEINNACQELGVTQKIMLRVLDKKDYLYSGQYGGFFLHELEEKVSKIVELKNIKVAGIASFPCFIYKEDTNKIEATNNIKTIKKANKIIKDRFKIEIEQLNMPSVTCCESVKLIAQNGGTHGEPGHGLTGTTPFHKYNDTVEIPSLVYLSEISHNLGKSSYCYGGGHYRRSNMENAIVGASLEDSTIVKVLPPTDESIDYHFELKNNLDVGTAVVMAFRTQVFVTRSNIAIIKGLSSNTPEVAGIYNSLGMKI